MEKVTNHIRTNANSEKLNFAEGKINFRVCSDETGDRIGIFEYEVPGKTVGAPVHIHKKMEEIFYVIEGEVHLIIGSEHIIGRVGDVILIPRGTIHGFSNKGEKPLKILIMFSPTLGQEGFFRAAADFVKRGEDLNSEAFSKIIKQYDQELVETKDNWLEEFN